MSLAIASNNEGNPAAADVIAFPPNGWKGPAQEAPDRHPAKPSVGARRAGHSKEAAYKLVASFLLADWLVAFLAIFSGLAFREWQQSNSITGANNPRYFFGFLLVWSLCAAAWFVWILALRRTYELRTVYNIGQTMTNVLKGVFFWSLSIWAFVGFFRVTGFTPRVGALYCMLTLAVFFAIWRLLAVRILNRPQVRNAVSSRIVVVDWNPEAEQLRASMKTDVTQLSEIVGCVPRPGGHFSSPPPADLPVLGEYESLSETIRNHEVGRLVLADTAHRPEEIRRLTLLCERELIGFQIILDYFQALKSGLQVQSVSGVPLLGRAQLPIDRTVNRFVKRTIDIVGALAGLAISAFIVPWFALMVYLESPGPVFYRQRRTSRSGHAFTIYKIRSMKLNAEAKTGAVWCKQEDDRRLKIGTFMRKWNVDELPQFFNVLVGDMSLVGPRPERPELIERFKDEIPSYNVRHEVRTGLTGWAQIQGLRGDTDLNKRIEADLYYIENWSVGLDLYCIFATFFKVKNAY